MCWEQGVLAGVQRMRVVERDETRKLGVEGRGSHKSQLRGTHWRVLNRRNSF